MIRTVPNLDGYDIPLRGDPRLHHEVAWYATVDDRVLGIVVRDRIDNDFGWVVLTRARKPDVALATGVTISPSAYRCVDMETSHPSLAAATAALHQAMRAAGTRRRRDEPAPPQRAARDPPWAARPSPSAAQTHRAAVARSPPAIAAQYHAATAAGAGR